MPSSTSPSIISSQEESCLVCADAAAVRELRFSAVGRCYGIASVSIVGFPLISTWHGHILGTLGVLYDELRRSISLEDAMEPATIIRLLLFLLGTVDRAKSVFKEMNQVPHVVKPDERDMLKTSACFRFTHAHTVRIH